MRPGPASDSGAIGYWLGPEHWGRGYAREATAAFVAYLFAAFDFERLEAWTFAPNRASRRVLEACGFRLEGIARRSVVKNGEVMDSCMYALLRGEEPPHRPQADRQKSAPFHPQRPNESLKPSL